jgi:hypothetical protein
MNETKWPETRPQIPPLMHGWFTPENAEMLSRYVHAGTTCIIEIGSWYGMSAKWFCERAPLAQVYCIDPWEKYPEILTNAEWKRLQPGAYDNFVNNLWDYRQRVHILQMQAHEGIYECRWLNPDLVYIDGDHSTVHVEFDVSNARLRWPDAVICGDDWGRKSVQQGILQAVGPSSFALDLMNNGQCWALRPLQPNAGAV